MIREAEEIDLKSTGIAKSVEGSSSSGLVLVNCDGSFCVCVCVCVCSVWGDDWRRSEGWIGIRDRYGDE